MGQVNYFGFIALFTDRINYMKIVQNVPYLLLHVHFAFEYINKYYKHYKCLKPYRINDRFL